MGIKYYKNTYLTNDEDGNPIERITADYKEIGKYIVGVTVQGQAGKMRKVASTLNKMVRARGEEPIFKVIRNIPENCKHGPGYKYMVVRKLIPDDKLEFIDHTLLDWEDIQ